MGKHIFKKYCYNCGSDKVIWQNDWDFDDLQYEGNGIISLYTCGECGAEIEVSVSIDEE